MTAHRRQTGSAEIPIVDLEGVGSVLEITSGEMKDQGQEFNGYFVNPWGGDSPGFNEKVKVCERETRTQGLW